MTEPTNKTGSDPFMGQFMWKQNVQGNGQQRKSRINHFVLLTY